jgi:hypothetical protein
MWGSYSIIIIIGKKNKNVVLVYVDLFHGCGEIALHWAHRVSSVKCNHSEELHAVICESVAKAHG